MNTPLSTLSFTRISNYGLGYNFDDIIDPRETRPRIIRALRAARARNAAPLGPKTRHGIMP